MKHNCGNTVSTIHYIKEYRCEKLTIIVGFLVSKLGKEVLIYSAKHIEKCFY